MWRAKDPRFLYLVVILVFILIFISTEFMIVSMSDKEMTEIVDALDPVCVDIPSDTYHKGELEAADMFYSIDGVDLTDTISLGVFCSPYVYAQLKPELGNDTEGDCAPNSPVRGKYCSWYHMCVWPMDKDRFVSNTIIQTGLWERSLVRYMVNTLRDKPRGIVIDAGSNIGQYAIIASAMGHQVIAFEPLPQHVELIKKSLALNGFSSRAQIFRNALSDYTGQAPILFHKQNKGASTVADSNFKGDIDSSKFTEEEVSELETQSYHIAHIGE